VNRVLLINKTKSPSREELTTCERRTGELMFADFPELRYAGYVIVKGRGIKAANWIVPKESFESFKTFLQGIDPEFYEIQLFTDGTTPSGGQTEVLVDL